MSQQIQAADVLKESHPLNNPFRKWLQGKGDAPATKRQARKFLSQFPQFKAIKAA
jgi:hypothetical protein